MPDPSVWTMPVPDEVEGPTVGPDHPMLRGYLAWQRDTLLRICGGLTGEQLAARPVASSALSLLGLVRHLAKVERIWFVERFGGEAVGPLYPGAPDADFAEARAEQAPADLELFHRETARADEVAAGIDLDATITHSDGSVLSLRFVYLHVLHEYARHNGHADLLREAIDGVTGR